MEEINWIYAIKGGFPNVSYSTNPNFYLLCNDFHPNIGYIEKKKNEVWRLYTRTESLLKLYWSGRTEKFYYDGNSFQNCVDKLQELSGRKIKVLDSEDVEKLKGNK